MSAPEHTRARLLQRPRRQVEATQGQNEKTFRHAVVGDLTLGSPSEERLRLLASWAASQTKEPESVEGVDLDEKDHSSP